MSQPAVQYFELSDPVHGMVPCAAVSPVDEPKPLPLCLFLYGGGGNRESLTSIVPLLAAWWRDGTLPACRVATPDVGPWSFYLDDRPRGFARESFIVERFVPHLAAQSATDASLPVGLVGVSMGGYGALKLAFSRPHAFAAVAAVSPMLEPSAEAEPVATRNRYFYPPEVPQALLGPTRDAALYRSDHPAARAKTHERALRESSLGIYIDAAGDDFLHAHDGAEFLHRVLWQLDVPHEYQLRRDADHTGPDLPERLRAAFAWVGRHLQPTAAQPEPTALEVSWLRWLEGRDPAPPATELPITSPWFVRVLRARVAVPRRAAAEHDPSVLRRYGLL